MSDRNNLKEKIRKKIGIDLCRSCTDEGVCHLTYHSCDCEEYAEAALTAIESAGYIIMPKDEIVKQVAGIRFRENADG